MKAAPIRPKIIGTRKSIGPARLARFFWDRASVARNCHNHKYDPFTQQQFYKMVAFFNNVAFAKWEWREPERRA